MTAAFDRLAATYDETWTDSPIGRAQRDAVWRRIDPLFRAGDSVLDLGCGTGEDALHLMRRGVRVKGIDASGEMVRIARTKGVDARQLPIERVGELDDTFDGAISNFGALNCSGADPLVCAGPPGPALRATLSARSFDRQAGQGAGRRPRGLPHYLHSLIRSNGYLAICLCGPFCAWETCYYLRRLDIKRAFRRLRPGGVIASFGVHVTYPTVRQLRHAFHPHFELRHWYGIGLFVPPSYVGKFRGAALDRRFAHWPVLRAMADHRLLVFQRA